MGYRKSLRFLTLFALIFSFGAYGLGQLMSCASEELIVQEVAQEAEPVVTETGSEVFSSNVLSPGDNSPNTIDLSTQITGFGTNDGYELLVTLVTDIPGLTEVEDFPVPLINPGAVNQWVWTRSGPLLTDCPAPFGFLGVRQNGGDTTSFLAMPKALADALVPMPNFVDQLLGFIETTTGCNLIEINEAVVPEQANTPTNLTYALRACLFEEGNENLAAHAPFLLNLIRSHLGYHLRTLAKSEVDGEIFEGLLDENHIPYSDAFVGACLPHAFDFSFTPLGAF